MTTWAEGPVTTVGEAGAPAVLVLHPWWGVTPGVLWWADQLASAGRRAVVPDLFGGATPTTEDDAEAHAQAVLNSPDAVAYVERCGDDLAAEGRPWAAMGWSMGAFLACGLAGRGAAAPHDLVLFYGGWPPGGEVGTRRVDMHVVPGDGFFDEDEEREPTEAAFRDAGVDLTVHEYPGQEHWFAEPGSPTYDEVAAALARDRVLDRLRAG